MNITQRPTSFYTRATTPRPPVGLVIHNTVSLALATPTANGSWHYEVDRDGSVVQFVPDAGYAWHVRACDRWRPPWMVNRDSRVSEANSCTLGIELVSFAGNSVGVAVAIPYTDQQYDTLRALLALLYGRYGVLPVVGHGQLQVDRSDPVALDYGRAGLVWRGDGYRYEGEQEDMARVAELEGLLAEQERQIAELRETIAQRDSRIGSLEEDVEKPLRQEVASLKDTLAKVEPRIAEMEEALRQAVAQAARRPERVEVVVNGERVGYVPEVA